jgi:hypothetical protein
VTFGKPTVVQHGGQPRPDGCRRDPHGRGRAARHHPHRRRRR